MLLGGAVGLSMGLAAPAAASLAQGTAARSAAAELSNDVASTFAGSVHKVTLTSDVQAFRYSGGVSEASGRFLTTANTVARYGMGEGARAGLNLPAGATAEHLTEWIIPKGTTIYAGRIAGGAADAVQVFVKDPSVLVRP
jgi:hypothetical protein